MLVVCPITSSPTPGQDLTQYGYFTAALGHTLREDFTVLADTNILHFFVLWGVRGFRTTIRTRWQVITGIHSRRHSWSKIFIISFCYFIFLVPAVVWAVGCGEARTPTLVIHLLHHPSSFSSSCWHVNITELPGSPRQPRPLITPYLFLQIIPSCIKF